MDTVKQCWQEYDLDQVSAYGAFVRKKICGNVSIPDVTSYEWLFTQIDFYEGVMWLKINSKTFAVPAGKYGFFAPPFSVYHYQLEAGRVDMRIYLSISPKPRSLPNAPVLFRWRSEPFEGQFAAMSAALQETDEILYTPQPEDQDDLARRIKSGIDNTFQTAYPLAQLADEIGVSTAYFSRIFRKKYGLTAVDYRSKLRSVWAVQQLIRRGNRNISDLAFELGYNDLSRFNKQFRRHVGMTPGAIRKLRHR